MPDPLPPERALGNGFAVLSGATLALIVVGALVRAHGAGLACPDWPLCFGRAIPQFDVKVAFEVGHRYLAGCVALGLFVLGGLLVRQERLRRAHGRALAVACGLLAIQVLLGGATVLLKLAPWTVTAHLLVGTALFATLAWISADLRSPLEERVAVVPRSVGLALSLALGLLAAQLVLGGTVSSRALGLACAHFPSCDGKSVVPTLAGGVGIHVVHRLNGYALLLAYTTLAWLTRSQPRLASWARAAVGLIGLQIGIGAANVLLQLPRELTALHTLTAAGIALMSALLLRAWLSMRALEPATSAPRVAGSVLEAR